MTSTIEEREVSLAAPAHDLAPRIHSGDPADFPVLTGREEEWRFTPLERLGGLHDGSAAAGPTADLDFTWSTLGAARVETLAQRDPRVGAWFTPSDRVSAQAFASASRAVAVTVAPEAEAASAHVTFAAPVDEARALFGHVLVEVGANAHAVVILDHVTAPGAVATTSRCTWARGRP